MMPLLVLAQAPVMTLTPTDVSCNGDTNGTIVIDVDGCTGPYTFTVNGVDTTVLNITAGDWSWAKGAGGTGEDWGTSIAIDNNDNVYVTGYIDGAATFDTTNVSPFGGWDIFLAKYDPTGTLQWVRTAGGTGFDAGQGVAVDANGDVYITGYFEGTAAFDGTNSINALGSFDAFLAKYDPAGNLLWVFGQGGPDVDNGRAISFDNFGSVYMVGEFENSMNIGLSSLTSLGMQDIFLARYDATTSNPDWGVQYGGDSTDRCYDVYAGYDGAIFICGLYDGLADFQVAALTTFGDDDAYIAKIDTTGIAVWAKQAGSSGPDAARGVSADAAGNAYLTGYASGTATFDGITQTGAGNWDHFVTQYDTSGVAQWATLSGGPGFDIGYAIETDSSGFSHVSGEFGMTADFGNFSFTQAGNNDAVIAKFDSAGQVVWAEQGGGANYEPALSIAVGSDGASYTTGVFYSGSTDFGANNVVGAGFRDIYVAKLEGGSATTTLTNLSASTYMIELTDINGVVLNDSAVINEPTAIVLSSVITTASSSTANDGAVDLTVTGGTPSYTFLWSNAFTTEDLINVSTGTYTVTVTDTNGCTETLTATIDTIIPLTLNLLATEVTCIGTNNGTLDLTVTGGTAPYTYSWSNGPTVEDQSGLAAGTYTVTVTDSVGTTATEVGVIGSNPTLPSPVVSAIAGPGVSTPNATHFYSVNPTNGSSYSWSVTGGGILSTSSNVASVQWGAGPIGTVTVTETNIVGCQDSGSVDVTIGFVGIDEGTANEALMIYPNPADNQLNVTLATSTTFENSANLRLLSLSGQVVLDQQWSVVPGVNRRTLDVSAMKSGVYFLFVVSKDNVLQQKVVLY